MGGGGAIGSMGLWRGTGDYLGRVLGAKILTLGGCSILGERWWLKYIWKIVSMSHKNKMTWLSTDL